MSSVIAGITCEIRGKTLETALLAVTSVIMKRFPEDWSRIQRRVTQFTYMPEIFEHEAEYLLYMQQPPYSGKGEIRLHPNLSLRPQPYVESVIAQVLGRVAVTSVDIAQAPHEDPESDWQFAANAYAKKWGWKP